MEAGALPPGSDQTRGPGALAAYSVLLVLVVGVLSLRAASRFRARTLSSDDYIMFLAGVSFGPRIPGRCVDQDQAIVVAESILIFFMVHFGYGKHIYTLDLPNLESILQLLFIAEILGILGLFFVKLSVALFLLRIGGLQRWMRWGLIITTAILACSTASIIVIYFVQCRPISGNWNPLIHTRACVSPHALVASGYASTGKLRALTVLPRVAKLRLNSGFNLHRSCPRHSSNTYHMGSSVA